MLCFIFHTETVEHVMQQCKTENISKNRVESKQENENYFYLLQVGFIAVLLAFSKERQTGDVGTCQWMLEKGELMV